MSVDAAQIRAAIVQALPTGATRGGQPPQPGSVYLPPAHSRVLSLENSIVVGARGAGKSFWWLALQQTDVRAALADSLPPNLEVSPGFGESPAIALHPDPATFQRLLHTGNNPKQIWRAVLARWADRTIGAGQPAENWLQTVRWASENPEPFARKMEAADASLRERDRQGLIIFDALDRTSDSWPQMNEILRDLLRIILELRGFARLHAKVFLRDDQLEGQGVQQFPDASKLLATRVELTWGSLDLHGMLWQYLISAPGLAGDTIRDLLRQLKLVVQSRGANFRMEHEFNRSEPHQRLAFEALAGKQMGAQAKRGVPYTWAVHHVADSRGNVSPRSFVTAIREAAEDSTQNHPTHRLPLHHESIKVGVLKASETRVKELAEDYPWITDLMRPLAQLTVPSRFSEIRRRWADDRALQTSRFKGKKLPPEHLDLGPEGVRDDLENLGIFQRMADGMVNMPDIYRIGFGLGRKGGVKPVRKTAL